jgi:hypothetical protein
MKIGQSELPLLERIILKVSFNSVYSAEQKTLSNLKSLYRQFKFCKDILKSVFLPHGNHPIATFLDILGTTFCPSLSFPLVEVVAKLVLVASLARLEESGLKVTDPFGSFSPSKQKCLHTFSINEIKDSLESSLLHLS